MTSDLPPSASEAAVEPPWPAVRLWLDDVRRPPSEDWTWAKSVEEAIKISSTGTVAEMSLDNDLYPFEHDGFEVVEWMAEHHVWPNVVRIHTSNRVASTWMAGLLERHGYRAIPGRPRHFAKKDGVPMPPAEFAVRNTSRA